MITLINVLLVNLFEAYNLFLIHPIILFVLMKYGIVDNLIESRYYLCLFNAVYSMSQFISLHYWDNISFHIGKRLTMIIGLLLTAISYVLFGFSYNIYMLLASRFILGLNTNIPITRTFLLEKLESNNKMKYILLSSMSWRIGAVLGSFVGGTYYSYVPNFMESLFKKNQLLFLAFISALFAIFLILINLITKCKTKNITINEPQNNTTNEPHAIFPIVNNIQMEIERERNDYVEDITICNILCNKKYIFFIIGSVLFNATHIAFADVFRLYLMNKNINGGYSYNIFYIQLAMFISNLLSIILELIFKLLYYLWLKCTNIKLGYLSSSFFAIPFICAIPFVNSVVIPEVSEAKASPLPRIKENSLFDHSSLNLYTVSLLYSLVVLSEGWCMNTISLYILKTKNKVFVGTLYGAIQNITNIVQILLYLCFITINTYSINFNLSNIIDHHTVFYITSIFIIISTIFIKIHKYYNRRYNI